ncbi:MAG: iron-containing redox enzyme family protein [Candidatus Caenarcaniphilales bacterium]|nr:iron-containing redox enzyme family protein [Candidatus Caenarcaniphilales bacterium]
MLITKPTEYKTQQELIESLSRRLLMVWSEFDSSLNQVPIINKIQNGNIRTEDYKNFLLNIRQQVVEGSGWISRAASNISEEFFDLRSTFLKHSVSEHKDFQLLERNYLSLGGDLTEIQNQEKNIGSEALSAFMYYEASKSNPFHLLGSMFIIEGLGQRKALEWGKKIKDILKLQNEQISFLLYHGENDDNHMQEFYETLAKLPLNKELVNKTIKTAKVTARLYKLQLEEIGNY